jgi:hypothetical protein
MVRNRKVSPILAICVVVIAFMVTLEWKQALAEKGLPPLTQAGVEDTMKKWEVSEDPTGFTDCRIVDIKNSFVMTQVQVDLLGEKQIRFVPAVWEWPVPPQRGQGCTLFYKEVKVRDGFPLYNSLRPGLFFAR